MRKGLKTPKDPLDINHLPEKFPKVPKKGLGKMDYSDSSLAFPKSKPKAKKKGRWGRK